MDPIIQTGKELTPFSEHLSFGIHIQSLLTAGPHKDMSWNETLSAEEPIQDQNTYNILIYTRNDPIKITKLFMF